MKQPAPQDDSRRSQGQSKKFGLFDLGRIIWFNKFLIIAGLIAGLSFEYAQQYHSNRNRLEVSWGVEGDPSSFFEQLQNDIVYFSYLRTEVERAVGQKLAVFELKYQKDVKLVNLVVETPSAVDASKVLNGFDLALETVLQDYNRLRFDIQKPASSVEVELRRGDAKQYSAEEWELLRKTFYVKSYGVLADLNRRWKHLNQRVSRQISLEVDPVIRKREVIEVAVLLEAKGLISTSQMNRSIAMASEIADEYRAVFGAPQKVLNPPGPGQVHFELASSASAVVSQRVVSNRDVELTRFLSSALVGAVGFLLLVLLLKPRLLVSRQYLNQNHDTQLLNQELST